jgi:hypothetical protein
LRHFDENFPHDLQEEHGQTTHIRTDSTPANRCSSTNRAAAELLTTTFLVFFNAGFGINVLYRRRNGDFGLIRPTLP